MKNKHLGRGLDALIGSEASDELKEKLGARVVYIPTEKLVRNKYQPRKIFNQEALDELEKSIRETGIIQPILVRKVDDSYHLIAGERRMIAARQAGLKEIPALIKAISDANQVLEIALIENIQREDLNPIEQARSYHRLIHEFGMTQEEVAEKVGKSRSSIANTVRLLELEEEIITFVENGKLSFGQARTLLSVSDRKKRLTLARRTIKNDIPVRKLEAMIAGTGSRPKKSPPRETDPHLIELRETLRDRLKTKIEIKKNRKGGGVITIQYFSADDLKRIVDNIS